MTGIIEIFCLQNFMRKTASNNGTQRDFYFIGYLFEQSLHHRRFERCVGLLRRDFHESEEIIGCGCVDNFKQNLEQCLETSCRTVSIFCRCGAYRWICTSREHKRCNEGLFSLKRLYNTVWMYGFEKVWKNLKSEQYICSHESRD